MSFYTEKELNEIGFRYIGKGVKISRKASIYNPERISVDDFSRIDDFCVLSAGENGIQIGKFVHIAVFCSIIGNGKITLSDFSGISSRVSIYSSNDDYSGAYLTNPTVAEEYKNVTSGPVFLGKHVIVGAGSIILPNVHLEEGVSIASLSLVNKNCKSFKIYGGIPIKIIKNRDTNLLELENQFIQSQKN
jgi:dTDP-4-amino-4,6-dideoxy-D-glucose acyltransferase